MDPYRKIPLWLLTRYDECADLLRDSRFSKDYGKLTPDEVAKLHMTDEIELFQKNMLSADPPDHARLRSLVAKAFTPHRIEGLRARISTIAEDLLDAVERRGAMELVADFSFPLPVTVICELLGVPSTDRHDFRRWTAILLNPDLADEDGAERHAAQREFSDYFKRIIEQRRAEPEDDLISELVAAEEDGDRLSENELVDMLMLLLIAGHETTVNLVTSGMLELMEHPEQRERLVADPSLLPSAVEEMLRYCGPGEATTDRFALEDLEIRGVPIRRGEIVVAALLSADRDETRFPDPDRFDVGRSPNKHLAFGYGIHFCLGAYLARLETVIAIETLLRRLPKMRLAVARESLEPSSTLFLIHGKKTLPVTF
jgi:cytochrome P450